ncbi:MAG: hypothetical protein OWQ48_05265 [Desulfurococcus sp.]|nr:hypothetical protein [Desulfurococcus sp.]
MSSKDPVKIMAELLKSGAVMLPETCPVEGCNLPLFKLKSGEIVCPIHGKVHVVRTEEEVKEVYSKTSLSALLDRVEAAAIKAVSSLVEEVDVDAADIVKWLEVLERVQRLKSMLRKEQYIPPSRS